MTGYNALRERTAWIDLSGRGLIRVSGEDRARLLHAMSTNHVKDLKAGEGCYAFFLNSQGRILCDAHIYVLAESIILDTEPETAAKLHDHLDQYIIADDVTLEDETGQWAILALEGPQSFQAAAELVIPVPEQPDYVTTLAAGFVARVASFTPTGLRLFVPTTDRATLLRRFADLQIPEATAAEARTVRLENAIPRYGEDITERYLVQETQALHAVHFNKGCYLGQEIVERVRSRAQLHRLLTPIRIEGSKTPAAGTKLAADGNPAGEITSAAYSPALKEVVALAYIRTEVAARKADMLITNADLATRAYIP